MVALTHSLVNLVPQILGMKRLVTFESSAALIKASSLSGPVVELMVLMTVPTLLLSSREVKAATSA